MSATPQVNGPLGAREPTGSSANDRGGTQPPTIDDNLLAPTDLFQRSLRDAEELLSYAAQTGRFPLEAPGSKESFKQWVIDGIMNARAAVANKALTKTTASAFWASFADLSRVTRPVTAESLRASKRDPVRALITVLITFLVFAVVLVSVYLFANTAMTNQLSEAIERQNKAALRLWSHTQNLKSFAENAAGGQGASQRNPRETATNAPAERYSNETSRQMGATVVRVTPEELFEEVVEFARINVSLRQTAWQYNTYFILRPFRVNPKPIDFGSDDSEGVTRLNVNPEITTITEIAAEASYQIKAYQRIRDFAEAAYKGNLVLWNGITAYLLPAVYALLGAGLYDLRVYAEMVRLKRYLRSPASGARYLIAFIAGAVIGLFGSLLPHNPSVPPLAIAFLVGYAVEGFLSRLDGFMDRIKGGGAGPEPPATGATAVAPLARGRAANE